MKLFRQAAKYGRKAYDVTCGVISKGKKFIVGGAATIGIGGGGSAMASLPSLTVEAPIDPAASAGSWLTVQTTFALAIIGVLIASGFMWMLGSKLRRKS
ncbi:MAG: hypothetical protein AAGB26_07485 [Planctomycetota bacterium]